MQLHNGWEAVALSCSASVKKVFLQVIKISQENRVPLWDCEFCEISYSNVFYRTPPAAASDG